MNTGGSTGDPLTFLVSTYNGFIDNIHLKHYYKYTGYTNSDLIVSFAGRSIPENLTKKIFFGLKQIKNLALLENILFHRFT